MKATQLMLALVVLLALTVSSAHVLASPIVYGASAPIVQEELKELTPQAAMPGDVSVFTRDGQPIGFRAADNLRVTVFHGLALKLSATVLNLPNEKTHRVWFGFPGSIDMNAYADWSERTDIKNKLQEARKAGLGRWYLGFPVGGNRWECWVPSDFLNVNQTTQIVVKLEGQFNKSKMKILWLITIKSWQGGRYEERIEVACVEAPPGAEDMPRERLFAHLEGFHPAWAAPVMNQPPGMMPGALNPPAPPKPEDQPVTRNQLEERLSQFGEELVGRVQEAFDNSLARMQPTPQSSGTSAASATPATQEELVIRIAPEGGYQVLDQENDDCYIVSRQQKVYAIFSRPLKPEEAVERSISYTDASGKTSWTKPTPISPSQLDGEKRATFFYFTDSRISPGEHTLFVRVTGPNGELANAMKTLIIQEGH